MRTHGSLRVVLNTKVWPEMVVDRANVKSVRFTAMDDDQIKVFLVTVRRFLHLIFFAPNFEPARIIYSFFCAYLGYAEGSR